MKIIDILKGAEPRFTFELLPPVKGDGTEGVFDAVATLAPFSPAYINVTFHREERPGTIAISAAIRDRFGIETVPHLICGGLSRTDTDYLLRDMELLELDNVLALRGDPAKGENRFTPHPEGFRHADQLVKHIATREGGFFCIGVAGYPEKHSESASTDDCIAHLKRKVDAGADYVVTQMCFDNARIFDFIDRARKAGITVPIVPGIKPLATRAHVDILPRIFGIKLPAELVSEVEKCADNAAVKQVGIEWAAMQAAELKRAGVHVVHFYSMGRTDNIARIVGKVF